MTRPPQYVAAHVHDLLAADERLATLDIDVRVVERKVFLAGMVNTPTQYDVADALVREQLADYEVHNELTVAEVGEATAAQIEKLT